MSRDEANALLALKNAWQGAVASAAELERHLPAVENLAAETGLDALDLDTYYRVSSAHATAVMALHGLVQDLQKKASEE